MTNALDSLSEKNKYNWLKLGEKLTLAMQPESIKPKGNLPNSSTKKTVGNTSSRIRQDLPMDDKSPCAHQLP